MIRWHDNFYVSEAAEKKKNKIISSIKSHKLQFGAYVITLAANGRDVFDLLPAYMLSSDGYHGRDIEILGIAEGKSDAIELAAHMIEDVYNKSGEYHIREYFS